jgi:PAS domain-containing protein
MAESRRAEDKRGLSIGARLALATMGVLAIASVLLYMELTRRERQGLVAAKSMAAAMVADIFAVELAAPLDFADQDAIEAELTKLRANPEVSCAAVWGEDSPSPLANVAVGCDATAPLTALDLARPAVRQDRVEVARVIIGPRGKPVGKARIVFSLARENEAFAVSQSRIFWLSSLLAVGTAALLLLIARREIVLPLERLVVAAGRVGRGQLGARVDVRTGGEIGELGRAFNAMSEALADREERLRAATRSLRDLLDHMQQAIFAFDAEGRVRGEASRQARLIFGEHLDGASVQELLYGGAPEHDVEAQAFAEWRAMAFAVAPEDWPELAKLAPKDIALRTPGGETLPLEIELRPIEKDGRIERVMLLATDVSEKRRLERAVEAQTEEHARRMAAMRRLVAGGAQLFVTFTERAREQLGECLSLLGPAPREIARADVDVVFRRAHTMRSEARAFDLRELERQLAKVERSLATLREATKDDGTAWSGDLHKRLVKALHRADDAVLSAREDFVAASPIGRAALNQITVQRSDVEHLQALVGDRDDAVARVVGRLAARRFGESTATLLDVAPDWAARENKQVHLDIDGKEVLLTARLARVLPTVLVQLVRNAIAHGIETPLERTREGKEPRGVVKLRAKDGTPGPTVVVEDDGRGLDVAQIAARAKELGVEGAPTSELVFEPGLSTRARADDLAGRGVGLDAVRAELEGAGYGVKVESTPGKGTRYLLAPR